MDVDLLTRLEKLETKRKALNAQYDLTEECNNIDELKRRVSLVSDSISAINNEIQNQRDRIGSCCDKLNDIYPTMKRDSHRFELLSCLSKLNLVCRQIDQESLSIDRELFRKVANDFELVYKPLERKLVTRTDLPYANYANKLRNLELKHSEVIDTGSTLNYETHSGAH